MSLRRHDTIQHHTCTSPPYTLHNTMKTQPSITTALSLAIIAGLAISCSRSSRDEAIDRMTDAAKALNGKTDDTPAIVKAEQKKERERQDNTWTAENQRKHPLEYCRAMLAELDKKESSLEVSLHSFLTADSAARRELAAAEADVKKFSAFLDKAKAAYRSADEAGKWPVSFNGKTLSQDDFKSRIVDAGKKLAAATAKVPQLKDKIAMFAKKKVAVAKEQEEVAALREKFQAAIRDIELKKVDISNGELGLSLGSLRDSVEALCQSSAVGIEDDDFFSASPEDNRDADFDAIMGN